ncbi:trypsin-like serine protease [Streptomyces sp. NPDC007355]|uniref:trypsin-like serine protease n=1 Tax=Streptomyces sp. NPDC007355 TaxID=3364778 RepID=UPI0036B9A441
MKKELLSPESMWRIFLTGHHLNTKIALIQPVPRTPVGRPAVPDTFPKGPALRKNKYLSAAALLAAALGAVAAGPGSLTPVAAQVGTVSEQGTPPAGYSSWEELQAVQGPLVELADQIKGLVTRDSGFRFGSMLINHSERRLDVYWKGAPPSEIMSVLAAADGRGVKSAVVQSPYTQAELQAASQELVQDAIAAPGILVSVGPLSDASGLSVGVSGRAEQASEIPALRDLAIPVTIQANQQTATPASSTGAQLTADSDRWTDLTPLNGGDHINYLATNQGCTTAFNLNGPATPSGSPDKVLTAAHCFWNEEKHAFDLTQREVKIGANPVNVLIESIDQDHDIAVLRLNTNDTSTNKIWTDTPTLNMHPIKAVTSTSGSVPNEYVCTNGAYSGIICGIRVTETGQTVYNGKWWTYDQVKAWQDDYSAAAGMGDSGGGIIGSWFQAATVKGTLSTMLADPAHFIPLESCPGMHSPSGRYCSSVIWYTPITKLAAHPSWGTVDTTS